jgi:hypothetical protein
MKRRWILALAIIAVVVAASAAIILRSSEAPSAISVRAASDGAGGAIVAWQDNEGIHAQHINPLGRSLWGKGGLLVSKVPRVNERAYPGLTLFTIAADGTGGGILTWQDRSTFPGQLDGPPVDVYSQRVSADGGLMWGDDVKTGKVEPINVDGVSVVADGTGGAIFGWDDYKPYFRALHDDYFRVQKIGPDGRLQWGQEGVLVVASSPYQPMTEEEKASGVAGSHSRAWPTYTGHQILVGDGAQGAIAVWDEEDYTNGTSKYRVYGRRVDAEGNFAWPGPLLLKESSVSEEFSSVLVATGDGGEQVAVAVRPYDQGLMTFMCLDRDGRNVWQSFFSARAGYSTDMAGDGQGGIIISRREYDPVGPPSQTINSLYLQRVDSAGKSLWMERPVVSGDTGQSIDVDITGDAVGGAILAWRVWRTGEDALGKLLATGVGADGNISWGDGGLAIFSGAAFKYQGSPQTVASNSSVIVLAPVGKGGLKGDMVYAQKLDNTGQRLWGDGIRIDR